MRTQILSSLLVLLFHLSSSEQRDSLIVETLIYIDYTEYVKWVVFKDGDETLALHEMKNFYFYAIKRVNDIYQTVDRPGFKLSVSLVAYTVNQTNSIFADLSSDYDTEIPLMINKITAVTAAEDFYQRSQRDEGDRRTKYDLAAFVGNIDMGETMGLTKLGVVCGDEPVLLVSSRSSSTFITTLAHEIGHTLGAYHDGDRNDCEPKALYAMSASMEYAEVALVEHIFQFSECSLQAFEQFVEALDQKEDNCMKETESSLVLEEMKAPGQMYSLDQQCQMQYGPLSRHCGGGSVCRDLICFQPLANTCEHLFRQTALDGSQCGDRRWCFKDECVPDPRAPTWDQGTEHCHLGDFRGGWGGELGAEEQPFCEQVRSIPRLCYKAYYYNKCCQSCNDIQAADKECVFGDRGYWCDLTLSLYPSSCRLRSITKECCQSCTQYYPQSDIGSYDPVNTDTCNDDEPMCGEFDPLLCYSSLVITEERLDVGRVCEVVVCCLLWGVPSISLYHPTGFLKTRQVEIKREVTRQMKEYINKNNNNKNNNNNNNSKEESSLGRFSMEDGHFNLDDHLFILGGEEGDGMVVRVARTLANKKKNNSNNNNNICYKNNNNNNDNGGGDNNNNYCDNNSNDNRDSLEEVYKTREIMQEMQGFGEAEVILKMGGVCVGLCGYMPWNTRLTEILSVPSHTTITTASLLNTLHSFSSITQRSGV